MAKKKPGSDEKLVSVSDLSENDDSTPIELDAMPAIEPAPEKPESKEPPFEIDPMLPPGSIINEVASAANEIPVTIKHGERGTTLCMECIINGTEKVELRPTMEFTTKLGPSDEIVIKLKHDTV